MNGTRVGTLGFVRPARPTSLSTVGWSYRYCLQNRTTCRHFYPWPEQPQQQFDENTNRVALRRRCPKDDRWVVPHDLDMAMFSPSTINVLPFDPYRNKDQMVQYVTKYVAKGEKWYYIPYASEKESKVKQFLKGRTVGMCLVINKLLNFHLVRFTGSVPFVRTSFVPDASARGMRNEKHLADHPDYPDPTHHLNQTQKYFLRHEKLWHLRPEQYFRYFASKRGESGGFVREDTRGDEDKKIEKLVPVDEHHRHFDQQVQSLPPGTTLESRSPYGDDVVRRRTAGLAIPRASEFEPLGDQRESFYERKLLLGLAW